MDNAGQGARFLLIAACLVVITAGLRAAAPVLLPFFLALFLATLSLPLLVWFRGKRVPTAVAVVLTILTNVAALAAIALLVGNSLETFTQEAPKYADRLEQMAAAIASWLERRGIRIPPGIPQDVINPGAVLNLVGSTVNGLASVLSNFVLVVLTVIFILFEITQFPEKLRLALGDQQRGQGNFAKITLEVQRYLGIKTITSLATGILIGLWVAILGIDFPILWGLIAFLFNYIPNIGSILAAVPALLLALVQFGPWTATLAGIGYVVVNMTIGYFVEPPLMGRTLGLSTLVVFLSLVFWGWLWGPVGMLLSVPLTMVAKITLENSNDFRWVAILLAANPGKSE